MANEIAEFTFDSEEWKKFLTKLQKKWGDVVVGTSSVRRQFSGLISIFVYQDVMDHFKKEQGPKGAWDDWSDTYKKHLMKIGRPNNNKLQFDGRMRNAFIPSSLRNTNEGVLFYNNAKTAKGFAYAAHHDAGRSSYKGNPRPFMWLSDSGMNKIVSKSLEWLAEK